MGAKSRGTWVQKSAALFMYLSMVITGPICLLNGGNIIAWWRACVCVIERFLWLLYTYKNWKDAIILHGSRAVGAAVSVYLFIRRSTTKPRE